MWMSDRIAPQSLDRRLESGQPSLIEVPANLYLRVSGNRLNRDPKSAPDQAETA
jgi:hypothetical protein